MINIRVPATKKTQKSREENTEKGPLGQLIQSIWRMRGEKDGISLSRDHE